MKIKKKAFTLVELIVVISILSILGTLGFISFQGYTKSARDTKRITDIKNINDSLDLNSLNTGEYPMPDLSSSITYLGSNIWYQGVISDGVIMRLKGLTKIPLDPLTKEPYIYSVTKNLEEYQVLALYEGYVASSFFQANAQNIDLTPKIEGNYNGVFIKTREYLIPLPSIITAEKLELGIGKPLTLQNIKSLVTTNGKNIPTNILTKSVIGQLEINLSVFNGNISSSLPESSKIAVINKIKEAYSGSSLINNGKIAYILNKTSTGELLALYDNIISGNVSTLPSINTNITGQNGVCGIDNGQTVASTPINLCNSGNSTTPILSGNTYTWSCSGSNGGSSNSCSTNYDPYLNCNGAGLILTGATTYGSCNTKDIIVCGGSGSGYTIAACNVGTNIAGVGTGSYGGLYQWGNNYNSRGGQFITDQIYPTISSIQITSIPDYSTYSSTAFITTTSMPFDWTTLDSNGALRSANWNPCATGYHVPSNSEWVGIHTAGGWGLNGTNMSLILKMPMAGIRIYSIASLHSQSINGYYWSSTPNTIYGYYVNFHSSNIVPSNQEFHSHGMSVRCLKN